MAATADQRRKGSDDVKLDLERYAAFMTAVEEAAKAHGYTLDRIETDDTGDRVRIGIQASQGIAPRKRQPDGANQVVIDTEAFFRT